MKPRVLVTDGEQRAALAVVRSLGRGGYQVAVAASRTPSLAGASRWAASERQVPDALRDPAGFVDAVAAMAYAESAQLLLPMTDASLLALLDARERFPNLAAVSFPSTCSHRAQTSSWYWPLPHRGHRGPGTTGDRDSGRSIPPGRRVAVVSSRLQPARSVSA
jgi:hypothetical protein